ncbi:MAG: DUF1799 domain-containing protein [Sphingomonadaceae bacterium]
MLGLPADAIASLAARREADGFEVWPECWPALQVFLKVQTQWRAMAMMDGRTYWHGLDYDGVLAGLKLAGMAHPASEVWADVQVMEAAARNQMNGVMEG